MWSVELPESDSIQANALMYLSASCTCLAARESTTCLSSELDKNPSLSAISNALSAVRLSAKRLLTPADSTKSRFPSSNRDMLALMEPLLFSAQTYWMMKEDQS